jgi:hypothetical protein
MDEDAPGYLLWSAQRALLGHVTPNLRSFSLEKDGRTIRTMAVFAEEPTADEVELMSLTTTYIVADFADGFVAESMVVSQARPAPRLMELAYGRGSPTPKPDPLPSGEGLSLRERSDRQGERERVRCFRRREPLCLRFRGLRRLPHTPLIRPGSAGPPSPGGRRK